MEQADFVVIHHKLLSPALIAMKEAAGRPKDLLMASEYRVISDELRRPQDG